MSEIPKDPVAEEGTHTQEEIWEALGVSRKEVEAGIRQMQEEVGDFGLPADIPFDLSAVKDLAAARLFVAIYKLFASLRDADVKTLADGMHDYFEIARDEHNQLAHAHNETAKNLKRAIERNDQAAGQLFEATDRRLRAIEVKMDAIEKLDDLSKRLARVEAQLEAATNTVVQPENLEVAVAVEEPGAIVTPGRVTYTAGSLGMGASLGAHVLGLGVEAALACFAAGAALGLVALYRYAFRAALRE